MTATPFDDVANALLNIAHLDLGLEFDIHPLFEEFNRLDERTWRPYESKYAPLRDFLAKGWHGASLVGPNGETYGDLSERLYDDGQKYSITELGKVCPNMMKVVETLGGEENRARVMIVKAGHRLNWHSHFFDGTPVVNPNQKYEIVVHVPIIAPLGFKYSVMSMTDHRMKDFEMETLEMHVTNYPPGQAWVFNSYHMHNVFNHTPHDRVSIMMYLNLRNIKTFNIVSDAVYKYKGPFIK